MSFERLTDEQLLAIRTRPDAGLAFGCFYRRHERLIVAYHMRRTSNAETAADLTSETFARAIESRYRFEDRGEGAAGAWLYGIARFVLSHHLRRAETAQRIEASMDRLRPVLDDVAMEAIEAASSDAAVLQALEMLPSAQRDAIRGYVIDDVDYEDLAGTLNVDPATVRKRVSRGLSVLREKLGEDR